LSLDLRLPLSAMSFLEFAIWGAWFVVLGQYLHSLKFTGKQIGSIYATMSLGGIISPIFFGAVADRFIAAQWLLAVLHLVGAAILFWMAHIRTPRYFYLVTLAYAMIFAPTQSLHNAIIFRNVPDGARDFGDIRVLGTIGWIASNLFLKVLLKPGEPVNNRPLLLASVLSIVLGVFSFILPNTPPTPDANLFPFLDALELFRDLSFAVFFGISFLISALAMAFYFSFTSLYLEQQVRVRPGNVGPLMTIGQWMEIIFMLTLGWFLNELGMKTVLVIGMVAWAVRYGIFALGRPFALVVVALALHGICFDFFFAAGMIHVSKAAPSGILNSAQALYVTLTYGLGMYLGTEASGRVNQWCTRTVVDPATNEKIMVTNWTKFWLVPAISVVVCLILFVLLFH
jgi:nucleoside transporter